MSHEPESLRTILAQVEAAVRRAYGEGYRQGAQDAADRMQRAAIAGMEARLPAILGEPEAPAKAPIPPELVRRSSPRVGLEGNQRIHVYGSVIATIRKALLATPETGITSDEMLRFCRANGVDTTMNSVRDTVKRLRHGEEIERRHGAYFPGPRLKSETAINGEHVNGLFGSEERH